MLPLTLAATRALASIAARAGPWLVQFATRLVARRLDVPEVVLHGICLYAAAYVSEVERHARLVCPMRVLLDLRRRGSPQRGPSSPSRAA